jgi:hypothetical protein
MGTGEDTFTNSMDIAEQGEEALNLLSEDVKYCL